MIILPSVSRTSYYDLFTLFLETVEFYAFISLFIHILHGIKMFQYKSLR